MGGMMSAAFIFVWLAVGIALGFILIDVVIRIGTAVCLGT